MKKLELILIALFCIFFVACENGKDDIKTPLQATLQFTLPQGIDNGTLSNMTITMTDINTGIIHTQELTVDAKLKASTALSKGLYRIQVKGTLNYRDENLHLKSVEVQAHNDGVELTQPQQLISLSLFLTKVPTPDPPESTYQGFVLAEIFCAGTASPQGSYYYADKYFVIYNNTDHVLYADSLAIAESDFLTVMKNSYIPDIMSTDFTVAALYMIPGSGHDHPVEPGGKLLLVDNAQNHTLANPNSWNQSTADFEWYDESTKPEYTDINNPDVPDLVRIFSKTLTMWSPHTQGFKSYALVRMHKSPQQFILDQYYRYTYHIVGFSGEADMAGDACRVPNSWVVDAVNMSAPAMFKWIVTDPSLDCGYTYSSEFGWDDTRFGKSVRRKVASREGKRAVLQDTNNSTEDFEPRAKANPFHQF